MTASQCVGNPTPPPAGRASTNNWDTAFAITFANANKAIKAQKSSPAGFSGTKPGGGFSGPAINVKGSFGDWQLSGGSGSFADLTLPISGTATAQSSPPETCRSTGPRLSRSRCSTCRSRTPRPTRTPPAARSTR